MTVYRCPSDRGLNFSFARQAGSSSNYWALGGRSNYFGVNGGDPVNGGLGLDQTAPATLTDLGGTFGGNSNIGIRTMSDGTSNVLMVGEGKFWEITGTRVGPTGLWAGVRNFDNGDVQFANAYLLAVRTTRTPMNTPPGTTINSASTWQNGGTLTSTPDPSWHGFASDHAGAAQFLLGDGSVRILTENLDAATYINLGLIKDGNVLGEF